MHDGGLLEYSRIKKMTIQAWSPFQYGFFALLFYDMFYAVFFEEGEPSWCSNILEISGSSTESESHNYYQMDADGRTYIETVSYQYYPEVWIRQDGVDGEQVEITKSEFDAVVASYPRIALDMKPISEFPMP